MHPTPHTSASLMPTGPHGKHAPVHESYFPCRKRLSTFLQARLRPQGGHGQFPSNLLPEGRTRFLDASDWEPIGPFPRALDFYGDGSLYIIDAPGHLLGHINVFARTSSDGAWIYLAGDSAHHKIFLTGESDIAVVHSGHVHQCAHEDKEKAEEHLVRIRVLRALPRVRVLLAHDEQWYTSNRGGASFWPGKIQSL